MRVFRQIFCLKILILFMALLGDIQAEIETRMSHNGGWACGIGTRAAIETTCYASMALAENQTRTRLKAIDVLLRTQNPDGSWPAFEGDDPEGCWTTSLALIAFRCLGLSGEPVDKAVQWLLDNKGREGHWFWKWKFRTVDRAVQFNPDKYGWPWFPGTVSWVIPTAFSLIALEQSAPCCGAEPVVNRIQLGTEMLRDRACPQGGWNAGNGIVFGSALIPHIDTTAIALLALTEDSDAAAVQGLNWLRHASVDCSSAYSLAWSAIAFSVHRDQALKHCVAGLHKVLSMTDAILNIETLSLAAIAINAAEASSNPFKVVT
jgi:Prenyltransferase and squalene oxidase repeat